ncbi:MAG: hypothetical protein GY723_01940 [bacterium]|nr:hypothetical protein [bacterium]MCP5071027.1 hypothetical protein [bacterium]
MIRFHVFRALTCICLGVGLLGCQDASIDSMVPGGALMTGELECWLHLRFDEPPAGIDPTDVFVVFRSEALDEETEFDWEYIAANDVVSGTDFGSGNRPNTDTTAATPPPIGETLKVRFPLDAKRRLTSASIGALWLEAELWWGGEQQDHSKSDIQRLYRSEDDPSRLPGY